MGSDQRNDPILEEFLNQRRVDPTALSEIESAVARNTSHAKRPQGILGAYLLLWAIVSILGVPTSLYVLLFGDIDTSWYDWTTPFWGAINLAGVIALLNWRKWGFYCLLIASLVMLVLSMIARENVAPPIFSVGSLAFVYVLLKNGLPGKKPWNRLT